MLRKCVGIDIGKSSIKAVAITTGWKKEISLIASKVVDIPQEGGMNEALKQLFSDPDFQSGDTAVSFSPKDIFFRFLHLPFTDKKNIKKTLPYQLEAMIPMAIDDVYTDYLDRAHSDYSEIFAASVPKIKVKELIELLAQHHISPQMIDAGTVPLVLCLLSTLKFTGSGMLLNVERETTTGVFFSDGAVKQIRQYAFGSDMLVSSAEGIPAGDPNNPVHDGDNSKGYFDDPCRTFLQELKQTVEFTSWTGSIKADLSKFYLTGSGCLHPDLQTLLHQHFSISFDVVDLASIMSLKIPENKRKDYTSPIMNQALSLALRPLEKNAGFDFFKSYAIENKSGMIFDRNAKWLATVAVIFCMLWVGNLFLDYRVSKIRLDKVKTDIAALFKYYVPTASRVVNPVQQLKTQINEAQKIITTVHSRTSGIMFLDAFKEISTLVPQSASLSISNLTFDENLVIIKGTATDFNAVDMVKNELRKSNYFKDVAITYSALAKQEGKVEFEMKITIRDKV